MLVIHPDECIDCLPYRAPDREGSRSTPVRQSWPNITQKKDHLPDERFHGMEGKFEKYFSGTRHRRLTGGR
jgi:hypothetical protein